MTKQGEWVWEVEGGEVVRVFVPKENQKPRQTKQRKSHNSESPYPHGHAYRYFTYGCRCIPCKEAATLYNRQLRQNHRKNVPKDVVHGRANTYKHFGCRCIPCRTAMREYQGRFRESDEAKARRNARKREKRRLERAKSS